MDDNTTKQAGEDLAARASTLNEIGEHYFVGWLVSAGFQRPGIMTEIERVLHDIGNDPALRHCTLPEVAEAPVFAVRARSLPTAPESAVVASGASPLPAAVAAPQNPLAVVPRPEPKPARRLPFAARLLAAIFHKPRMAA